MCNIYCIYVNFYLYQFDFTFIVYCTCFDVLQIHRRDRDCMVVGFITTYAISDCHHWCCESSNFDQGTPFSSTNKIDRHDIAEILL
jgi:hypothetical protein